MLNEPVTGAASVAKVHGLLGARRLLVVEDEPLVRMMVARTLQDLGYEVAEAASAAEALERMDEAEDRPFDAAIVDLGLPDRPGDVLVGELRARSPELPILVASGYGEAALTGELRGRPRLASLGKPYDVDGLHAALGALLAETTG